MEAKIRNRILVWTILFVAVLAVSLLLFHLQTPTMRPLVVFFPTSSGGFIQAERHLVPASVDQAKQLTYTIQGIIQGPLSMRFQRLLPVEAKIQSLFVVNDELFVDFSKEVLLLRRDVPLPPGDRLRLLERILNFNFSDIKRVYFLVNGQSASV